MLLEACYMRRASLCPGHAYDITDVLFRLQKVFEIPFLLAKSCSFIAFLQISLAQAILSHNRFCEPFFILSCEASLRFHSLGRPYIRHPIDNYPIL